LDNAIAHFGNSLTAELDAVEGKTSREINKKRTRIMEKWLDMPMRFRSPGAGRKKQGEETDVEQEFKVQGDVIY
jgi:hypothetical protein